MRTSIGALCVGATIVLCSIATSAHAELATHRLVQSFDPLPEDYEPGGAVPPASSYFGEAVAIRGQTAMIGIPGRVDGGAVAVFQRSASGTWNRTATLKPTDGASIGSTIALRDDTAVFGSRSAAYVFKLRNGVWVQTEKLTPPSADGVTRFDRAISYQDRMVVIGAERMNAPGAVYIYQLTWAGRRASMTRIAAHDGFPGDGFGTDVSMTHDTVVVGAPHRTDPTSASATPGAAYVFRRTSSGWREAQKLIAVDGDPHDEFGTAVAIDKGMILVGSPRADQFGSGEDGNAQGGVVYGFVTSGGVYTEQFTLRPRPDQFASYRSFGADIAIFSNRIAIVGADPSPPYSAVPGAHIFTAIRTGSTASLLGVVTGGYAGARVALANNWLLGGSRINEERCGGSCIGTAMLYDLNYVIR